MGRRRELVVDPGARPRPGEAQERRHHQQRLQEVPDHPAAPDAQALRGVEAVRGVPEEGGERRRDGRDEADEEEAGEVAPAPQLGVDVERDHRAPEDQHLEGPGQGEEERRHGAQAAHEGAGEVGRVRGNETPGRAQPDRGEEAQDEGRVDGDGHLQRAERDRDAVPVQVTLRMPVTSDTARTSHPEQGDATHPGVAPGVGEAREVPPRGALVLVVDRGQAPLQLVVHRRPEEGECVTLWDALGPVKRPVLHRCRFDSRARVPYLSPRHDHDRGRRRDGEGDGPLHRGHHGAVGHRGPLPEARDRRGRSATTRSRPCSASSAAASTSSSGATSRPRSSPRPGARSRPWRDPDEREPPQGSACPGSSWGWPSARLRGLGRLPLERPLHARR